MIDELANAIKRRQAILFAGAGISISVGLPSWSKLIAHLRSELELEKDERRNGSSYQTLAEYYRLKRGAIGPLRSWMDRNWSVSEDKVRKSKAHELIVQLDFPIIYTTNYDSNLEVAFREHGRDFVKIANARDLTHLPDGVTQIVKYHGDFDDDDSLVIAESDYFDRLAFDHPLDIKLRSDSLAKTVLFIGYSMSDLNIRLLLYRLWQTWKRSGLERDRPPSFVFMARSDPAQEAVLGNWGISVLSGGGQDPQEALLEFLTDLAERVKKQD